MRNVFRKKNVFLVSLEDTFILVDQTRGLMHSLTPAGAHAWINLESVPVPEPFLEQLRDADLLGSTPADKPPPTISIPEDNTEPRIIRSNMMLQVAASRPMHRGGWF